MFIRSLNFSVNLFFKISVLSRSYNDELLNNSFDSYLQDQKSS